MKIPKLLPVLSCLVGMCLFSLRTEAQQGIRRETYEKLMQMPDSTRLFDGKLTVYNIFKQQVRVMYEQAGASEQNWRAAMLAHSFKPYQDVWSGYVGTEERYIQIMNKLRNESLSMMDAKTSAFLQQHLPSFIEQTATAIFQYSGLPAEGKWCFLFGSKVTDMGGLGDGIMVLDMSHPINSIEHIVRMLPHEINHQVYDFSVVPDTTARGLYRCVNEGFAVYVNQKILGDSIPLQDYLMYSSQELAFCRENEKKIFEKLKPFLFTSNPDHALALASRSEKIFKNGGPGAIGYYIGYRIVEAYVEKHGPESWTDIYRMPVRVLWEKSGFGQ